MMDFAEGKAALLQALALLNDEDDLSKKIQTIIDSVQKDKSRTVTSFCEAMALQKKDVDQKKRCVELLEEVIKWWNMLVEDREKLLDTISTLEMEKEGIMRKQMDPEEIYGPLLEATSRKKPKLDVQQTQTDME